MDIDDVLADVEDKDRVVQALTNAEAAVTIYREGRMWRVSWFGMSVGDLVFAAECLNMRVREQMEESAEETDDN